MASDKQIEFFKNLIEERQFPEGTDTNALLGQFSATEQGSASKWIEKAMTLPKKGEVPPPF